MRFAFGRGRRRREIDEVRARIAQLRDEINKLEHSFEDSGSEGASTDAYRSVQRLRASMALEELIAKRTELKDLEAREAELEAAAPERAPTAPPRPRVSSSSAAPPLPSEPSLPSARAIIEPPRTEPAPARRPERLAAAARESATEPPTVAGFPEAPTVRAPADVPPAGPIDVGVTEPRLTPVPEPWPILDSPTLPVAPAVAPPEATSAEAAAVPEPTPAPEPEPPVEAPEAPTEEPIPVAAAARRGPGRAVVAALALLVVVGLGLIGASVSGTFRNDSGGGAAPQPTAPIVALAPTVAPARTATAPPATATSVPPTATSAPPTPAPIPTEPALVPTDDEPPDGELIEEPPVGAQPELSVILAPAGFTGAYLRSDPSMAAQVLRFLPNGTRVTVFPDGAVGSGFRWARAMAADGLTGWVVASTVGR